MAENTPLIKLTSLDYPEVRDTPLGAKSAGKTPGNSGFEEMRSRIKNSLFNHKAQSLSIITSKTALEDVDDKSDKSGGSTTLIAPFAKKSLTPSNPRLERYRKIIKGSLSLGTHASFGASEMNMSPFSRGEAMSDINLSSVSRTSVMDDQSVKAREADDEINTNRSDKTLELEEVKEISFIELDDKREEKKEEDEVVIVEISPKRQIFMNNLEQDIEELKKELKVEEDPDIHFIKGNFKDFYTEEEVLGEGTTATVKRCLKNDTQEAFAVKIVQYRDDTEMLVLIVKEFKSYKRLEHKHVIRVFSLYIDYWMKKIYTIMELAQCREMFEVLQDLGHYSEAVASSIFKQILSGINYLHTNGVCHRDLKPNNILVSDDGKIVKITDFNVSKFTEDKSKKYSSLSSENTKMWTHTGTIAFTAPEVFTEAEYTESVDMWSAGVVLYTMLSGYQPFYAEYVNELIEIITKAEIKFDADPWDNISDQAKDLVLKCLDRNPKTRFLPSDALMHPWIRNHGKVSNKAISQTVDNLRFLVNKRKERRRCNTKTDKDFKLGTIRTRVKRSETTVSPLDIDMYNRDGLIQGDMGAKEHSDCILPPFVKDLKPTKPIKANGLGNLPRASIKSIIHAPCLQIPECCQEEKDGQMSPEIKQTRHVKHQLMKEGIEDIDELDLEGLGNVSPFSLRRHQSMRVKVSSKERREMGFEADSSEDSYLDSEEEDT